MLLRDDVPGKKNRHTHTALATVTAVRGKFAKWIEERKDAWKETVDFWIGKQNTVNFTTTPEGVTYSVTVRHRAKGDGGPPIEVLVLFYEDFVLRFHATSKIMFSFIKSKFGDVVPSVEDALVCAEAQLNNESGFSGCDDDFGGEI